MVNLEENQFLEQMDMTMPLGFSRMRPGLILCLGGVMQPEGVGRMMRHAGIASDWFISED